MRHVPLGRAPQGKALVLLGVGLVAYFVLFERAGVKGAGEACLGGKESSPTSCRSRIRSLPILGDPGGSVSYI